MMHLARFSQTSDQHPDQIIRGRCRSYLVHHPPLQSGLSESCVKAKVATDTFEMYLR